MLVFILFLQQDTVFFCMSLFSAHSFSMSQSLSSAASRLERSFLHAVVWLRPAWSESNEISGGSYADTPSDGLITEKLRLHTGKNPPSMHTSPPPTTSQPLLPLCCVASQINSSHSTQGFKMSQKRFK